MYESQYVAALYRNCRRQLTLILSRLDIPPSLNLGNAADRDDESKARATLPLIH